MTQIETMAKEAITNTPYYKQKPILTPSGELLFNP